MVTAVCDELGVRVTNVAADQGAGAATAELDARPCLRVISIAKPRAEEETDKIYEPGRSNPLPLRARNAGLQLLQQLRDEAHRFSLSHHRKRRRKRTIHSQLDSIPGVGPVLRTRLLQHFGSASKVRAAPRSEIAGVPGVGAKLSRVIADAMRPEE